MAHSRRRQIADEQKRFFEVPDRSLLTLRGVGFANKGVSLEVLSVDASAPVIVTPEKSKPGDTSNVSEVRYEIRKSSRIRALSGSHELGQWTFDVVADALPTIALQERHQRHATRLDAGRLQGRGRLRHRQCPSEDAAGEAETGAILRRLGRGHGR